MKQYLDILDDIEKRVTEGDRATGTLSIFGLKANVGLNEVPSPQNCAKVFNVVLWDN